MLSKMLSKMLGVYNYTVVLTYCGMLVSFAGMTFALNGQLQAALICLMISGVCDMFDGRIAATKDRTAQEKRFGIQIDSLSDLICFGVLPALIVYTVCQGSRASLYISGLYLLCALIRLAWFNVDEEDRQQQTESGRETYLGLPVTSSALIVPAVLGIGQLAHLPLDKIGPVALMLMAVAFLTPFHLRKPAKAGKIGMIVLGGAELCILLIGVGL